MLNNQFSNVAVNAMANAFGTLLNNGYLRLYSGTQPANGNTALSGNTLLAELRYASTAFAAAVAGVINANTITGGTAVATGTATFFRAFTADGTTVVQDGSVGLSAANCILDSVDIVSGGMVNVVSHQFTQPLH